MGRGRMNDDRLAMGYEPNFDVDYKLGRQGELFVSDVVSAIGTERIEVKTDARAEQTGRVYIELECRGRPSGIQTTKSEFWAFVLPGDVIVIAKTSIVREMAMRAVLSGKTANCTRGSHPTKGAVVSLTALLPFLRSCTRRGDAA
jgi:hypothetical protein